MRDANTRWTSTPLTSLTASQCLQAHQTLFWVRSYAVRARAHDGTLTDQIEFLAREYKQGHDQRCLIEASSVLQMSTLSKPREDAAQIHNRPQIGAAWHVINRKRTL